MVQSPSKAWAIITAEDGKVTIMVMNDGDHDDHHNGNHGDIHEIPGH